MLRTKAQIKIALDKLMTQPLQIRMGDRQEATGLTVHQKIF